MDFKVGDKCRVTSTNSEIIIIEILPKKILEPQEVIGVVKKATIREDIGQKFEFNIDYLEKISWKYNISEKFKLFWYIISYIS